MEPTSSLVAHGGSPAVIVPIVMALVKPESVVDWGCNVGVWLHTFRSHGVQHIHGMDVWPRDSTSLVNEEEFTQVNFEYDIPIRNCDLAVCLENAEHLSLSRADDLIDALTASSRVVLFSAATPGQGGDCHLNEQPHAFWHYKFAILGYLLIDCIRWAVLRRFEWIRA